MPKKLVSILFIAIIFLSAFVRLWQLGDFPVSLNWDEISHGYNAYSMLETGRDQWGKLPIFNFRAYGDYPTTPNLYLTIPAIKLFGLNAFALRLPGSLLNLLTVPLTVLLVQLLFKNTTVSLLAGFFTAISPWSFFPARAVFQSNTASFLLISGITLSFLSLKTSRPKLLPLGIGLWLLSSFAYHNTKIAAPILLAVFFIIYRDKLVSILKINKVSSLFTIFTILLLSLSLFFSIINPESSARSRWVFLLNDDAVNLIEHNRSQFDGPPILSRLLYNKITYFVPKFFLNYLSFLNPVPLFFQGTGQYQFNIPNFGILFPITLPFYYLGLLYLIRRLRTLGQSDNRDSLFLLLWFIIGLLPSVITVGDFPVIRATSILPLPFIFTALGIYWVSAFFLNQKFSRIFYASIIAVTIFQFLSFWSAYFTTYPINYSQSWQYGYKQAIDYVKTVYPDYQQIVFTKSYGEPHQFVLFYLPFSPSTYQADPSLVWDYHASWYWVDAFDKFSFVNDWDIKNLYTTPGTLLITTPGNYPTANARLVKTIHFLDGQPAFDIVSYDIQN